jgi:hypothetical protein
MQLCFELFFYTQIKSPINPIRTAIYFETGPITVLNLIVSVEVCGGGYYAWYGQWCQPVKTI